MQAKPSHRLRVSVPPCSPLWEDLAAYPAMGAERLLALAHIGLATLRLTSGPYAAMATTLNADMPNRPAIAQPDMTATSQPQLGSPNPCNPAPAVNSPPPIHDPLANVSLDALTSFTG